MVKYYKGRMRDPRNGIAKLADLQRELRKTGIGLCTDELSQVFADFQDAGWGELKRGKPSAQKTDSNGRSRPREMAKGIADIAGGELQAASKDAGEHNHSFVLRASYIVNFKLPGDFSLREARPSLNLSVHCRLNASNSKFWIFPTFLGVNKNDT